ELWHAIIDHAEDRGASACNRLASLVARAEPEGNLGLIRTAGHHGLGVARPLYRPDPSPSLRAIIGPQAPAPARRPPAGHQLVEPLTERESVLLALLPSRLSNAEIASRLGVSVNTVKTHAKHIYRKLGSTGRSEAVTAAERM